MNDLTPSRNVLSLHSFLGAYNRNGTRYNGPLDDTYIHGQAWQQLTEIRGMTVSTTFLYFNHAFNDDKPILFETMVFDKKWNSVGTWRYSTQEEAIEGHKIVVDLTDYNFVWHRRLIRWLRFLLGRK